jgi:hypothetical protein
VRRGNYTAVMSTPHRDLIAHLAQIDQEIARAEILLLESLNQFERHRIIDLLAVLKTCRRETEAKLMAERSRTEQ